MYRLCSLVDPINHQRQSASITDLFDVRNPDVIDLTTRASVNPSMYYAWLKATITDDNYDLYLRRKVQSNHGVNLDDHPRYHLYQLYKQILQDKPKWLMEFFTLSYGDNHLVLTCHLPDITDRINIPLLYQQQVSYLDYVGRPADIWADNTALDGSAVFDTESLAVANQAIALLGDKLQEYLTTSLNRETLMEHDYLLRCSSHSRFINTSYKFLADRGIVMFSRPGRDHENIRPSVAHERYLGLSDDLRPRALFTAEFQDSSVYFLLKQPRSTASRDMLSQVLNYSTNVLDMLPFTIRGSNEQYSPLYGIELEACSDYSPQQIIAAQQELFFIMKQDGSISGEGRHKYEMVTVPCTFKVHKRLWAEFFNKVDYTQFDTSKSTGNGMHIHIDRTAFKAKGHLNRFTWFFSNPANFDFLFEISERPTKNDMTRWAPLPHLGLLRKSQAMGRAINTFSNLRGAVHFKQNKTVEIRMFKGVVSYATIIKNLEFIDSLFHYTLEQSITNITLPKYLAWLTALPKNRYSTLREFIAQFKNLELVMISNELKEYLFTESKPEVVLAKLKTAKFKVTNRHLTVLNKERRKRTFILDKEGNLQLAYSNGGKLASLDKSLQAKMTRGNANIFVNMI